jgi:predicted RNA-binding protein with RPS1 domain
MFPRGFLNRPSKEKGDSSKECRVSSENVKQLDMLREKASSRAEGEPSHDKVQQRDVGSSSEVSKMVAIPENFKWVGGSTTDLEEAELIFFGEAHISQHNKDIVDCISAHAKDGDIVLVEGVQAGEEIGIVEYALRKAITRGDLPKDQLKQATMKQQDEFHFEISKWCEQGVVRPFTKNVKIYGWDKVDAKDEMLLLSEKDTELSEKSSQEKERVKLREEYFKKSYERDEFMLKTINSIKNAFPDKRIFTIAGKRHILNSPVLDSLEKVKDQPYIALISKYEPTEKEKEDFIRKRYAERKNRWW